MKKIIAAYILFHITLCSVAQIKEGFIPVNDGKLYYQLQGTGVPVVFLHGVCLDHRMWEQQTHYFSRYFTCISIDLRGFGQSSVPVSDYSFHEDINTILDSLHINTPVTFIALSMGGKAAINFALSYPARTKALVLADAAVDGFVFKEFNLRPVVEVAKIKGVDSANLLFLHNPVFDVARKINSISDSVRQMVLSYSGWQWMNKNPITTLVPEAIHQLDRVNVPVLIITGEKDISDFQQIAVLLHKNIKQSIKKQIKGAGHLCNMEKPDEFNRMVKRFLKG